jgi:hypothetical protein
VVVTNSVSNASDQVIDINPNFAGGATDALVYTVIDVAAFTPTNAAGTARDVYLRRLDDTGRPLGASVQFAGAAGAGLLEFHSLAWSPQQNQYASLWGTYSSGLTFARATSGGAAIAQLPLVTTPAGVPAIVALADGSYGVAWDDGGNLFLRRLNASGESIGSDTMIASGGFPALAWNGREFGIAWFGNCGGVAGTCFARVSAQGNLLPGSVSMPNADAMELVWADDRWIVGWSRMLGAQNWEIVIQQITAGGALLGGAIPISTATSAQVSVGRPALAFTGSSVAVAWDDVRGTLAKIYLARLQCN